jgi:DNA sulfur modification protein DndD
VQVRLDGRVEMLDAEGRDLRQVDASAGESQVLALAVMSALSSFAPDFPIIVDTPLARLDPLHRSNVLTHFAGGGRQLILLTHPAELGAAEEAIIADRIAGVVSLVARAAPAVAVGA